VISGITSLDSFLRCVLRSFAFGKTGSMEPHDIFRVLDVNSGTEGLQVDCGEVTRKIRNKKQRRKNITVYSFSACIYVL
jgi:hypothetical protein